MKKKLNKCSLKALALSQDERLKLSLLVATNRDWFAR